MGRTSRRSGGIAWWRVPGAERWLRIGLLLLLAAGVAAAVLAVLMGWGWVSGGRGPAWMDFSASTNTEGAVRILEPGAR